MKNIAIIGSGFVGSTYAHLLSHCQEIKKIIIIDIDKDKAQACVDDLKHVNEYFNKDLVIELGSYSMLDEMDLVCITSSVPQQTNQKREDFIKTNYSVLSSIFDQIISTNFNGVYLLASNPVDALTFLMQQKYNINPNQIISSGTLLDESRYKRIFADKYKVDIAEIKFSLLGEHGHNIVPIYSTASIGQVNFLEYCQNNNISFDDLDELLDETRLSGYNIFKTRGMTNFGIANALFTITKAMIDNNGLTLSVGVCTDQGCISLPTKFNNYGVKEVDEIVYSKQEQELLDLALKTVKSTADLI